MNNDTLHDEDQLQRILIKSNLVARFKSSGMSLRGFARDSNVPLTSLRNALRKSKIGLTAFADKRARNGRRAEIDDRSLTSIKAARLDRAKELSRLRKSLLKTASRMLGQAPQSLPSDVPIILPPPEVSSEDEAPLDVPDLETESDDE